MKKLLLISLVTVNYLLCLDRPLKVLHITFHHGCRQDFEEVAKEFGLDLTTWMPAYMPDNYWEGYHAGNDIYNIGPRRAARLWERHKAFFNTFDVIATSDTAPLARIFLQNNWQKPLIIWVCNRFDYRDGNGGEDRFPDAQYYSLFKQATQKNNVKIISYTPYERQYASYRGIDIGGLTIKPIGTKEDNTTLLQSAVAKDIDKKTTLFIYPRWPENQLNLIKDNCKKIGLNAWYGVYNTPEDLKGFKGVIYFPYQASNLALFENLQRGIVHFVPTIRFMSELNFRGQLGNEANWSEWYFDEHKEVLVYFDSWQDLKNKVLTTDYKNKSLKIKEFAKNHRAKMLNEWGRVFAWGADYISKM